MTNIIKSIADFIKNLLPWVKSAASHGKDISNEIKDIFDNPAWDVVTSFTNTKLDDIALASLRQFLATLVIDLNLAPITASITGDNIAIGAVLRDASSSIANMQLPEAKAGTLNTINAAATKKIAELKGNNMPIETALSIAQPGYKHPELLA